MGRGNPRRGPPMVGVGRRVRFLFFCVGGRSPPTPPEMRKGHMATPCALFVFHVVVRLGALFLAWCVVGLTELFCVWLRSLVGIGEGFSCLA